ncbi:MAG: HAMP domain-containing protein [Clostridia bacterium]|nr:HAMP domain-containing protein [Clostridia bacterium]
MLKSLYFKVVLILLIFVVAVMCAVGAILMNGVTSYFAEGFEKQMQSGFSEDGTLLPALREAALTDDYPYEMKSVLASYGSALGIDQHRNYYILDSYGEAITGSDSSLAGDLEVTTNILNAVSGTAQNRSYSGTDYADWAVRVPLGNDDFCIVYVKDSLEEMRTMNGMLLSIIIQAMIIGVLIAVVLSFFLAKSISSPLQSLTHGTQLVASGEFSEEIDVKSSDEIGILAENFNDMRLKLKNTLEEVEGEREKLDTVLTCMNDGVVAFTSDGELLHCNESARSILGDSIREGHITPEEFFEKLDLPLTYGKGRIALTEKIKAESNGGFVFRDRISGDRVYDVSFAVTHDSDASSSVAGYVFIIHDVTGRYELDESRREFVANVSHELKTPLTSIKGATETVVRDPEMDDETRQYFLDMVLSESDRMTRIVSDLLVLSRLDNKRTKWNIETFDFRQSVRRLVDVMRPEFEQRRHEVTFGAEKDVPSITGDRQRLEQVVVNVLSNAIKYTPEGGHIDIQVGSTRFETVVLLVSDTGVGIPEEDLSHLFERFYRVEKSRSSDAGGTGLGLAIAKELVEAHGGSISINSKVNVGTTVRIELPIECKIQTETRKEI